MIEAVNENKLPLAREKHYLTYPIINHLFAEGNPSGIKECLKEIGIMENFVRLPLTVVSEERKTILVKHTNRINA
jgi:4-hydroxy-tetrahydrodipicolinate synthase